MGRQIIKYQTTTVEPEKSAAEIVDLVRKHGGVEFSHRWEGDRLHEVAFVIDDPEYGRVPIRLAARTETIEGILRKRTNMGTHRRSEQAYRIAWRQLRDLVDQLLLAVQTGLWTLTEAFMAGVETTDPTNGEVVTVGELFRRHGPEHGARWAAGRSPGPTTLLPRRGRK